MCGFIDDELWMMFEIVYEVGVEMFIFIFVCNSFELLCDLVGGD